MPTFCLPYVRDVGEIVAWKIPVPESVDVSELYGGCALLVTDSVAASVPTRLGVNVTLIVQEAFAATELLQVPPVREKSRAFAPVKEISEMLSATD